MLNLPACYTDHAAKGGALFEGLDRRIPGIFVIGVRTAVDPIQNKALPHDHVAFGIPDRRAAFRVLEHQVFQRFAVVGIFTCDVFEYSHDIHLPFPSRLSASA